MDDAAPLAGLRVLDFTQNLPGPYATLVLASLGAEVIKIEPPGGDTARMTPRLFEIVNAGKRSIVLDLKRDDVGETLRALVRSSDVVVEGFRPGVMARLGCDAIAARRDNPRLVYCSISGYGQDGPYRSYPGHDLNFQALTGLCELSRDRHEHPFGAALPIADLSSAMTASTAILAALLARARDGQGRVLDVAMVDTLLSWTHAWAEGLGLGERTLAGAIDRAAAAASERGGPVGAAASRLQRWLQQPGRDRLDAVSQRLARSAPVRRLARLRLHALPHYGLFRTRDDRWLSIAIVDEEKFWRALCRALGLPAVALAVPLPLRAVAGGPLRTLVARAIRSRPLSHWLTHLDRERIPVAPVLPLHEALDDPQLVWRRGGAPVGAPLPLAMQPLGPAPALGQHTEALLASL
ncbi:MAG: CoA transferase [Nannocystaceae bacterium]|nr:CoA transferase [Nannocystaceae bacterium]